ncbi:MAG: hypothetical protein FJ090_14575 [Deltaproteobacteria bacterium]|nr:hypothetical protein [Deltaproteobacteria bacterium]
MSHLLANWPLALPACAPDPQQALLGSAPIFFGFDSENAAGPRRRTCRA